MSAMMKDLKTYGAWTLACHLFSKATGIWEPYQDAKLAVNKKRNDVYSQTSEKCIPQLKKWWKYASGGGVLDLESPTGFDEKIQWLKVYDSTPLKTRCADKYLARGYVAEKIGDEHLVPLLGVWDSFDQIDFDALPNQFVLKTNHASGQIIVCKDKAKFNKKSAKKKFEHWMRDCWSEVYNSCELHYRDIPRKIIAEQYLVQLGSSPDDYKFYCFNGKVEFCQLVHGRNLKTHDATQAFLDRSWNKVNFSYPVHPIIETPPEKPSNYEEMISLAEKLSADFCFVRVDFYDLDGQILFGELTFTPDSGNHTWEPAGTDAMLGAKLVLPKEKYILQPVR